MLKFSVLTLLVTCYLSLVTSVYATASEWDIKKNASSQLEFNYNNQASSPLNLDANGTVFLGPTTLGSLRVVSLDSNTVNLRPNIGNGDIVISDDSGTAARGITIANGGALQIGGGSASSVRLEVAQGSAIKVGNAYLSSGADQYMHLGSNAWFSGTAWNIPDASRKSALLQFANDAMTFHQSQTAGAADWAQRLTISGGNVMVHAAKANNWGGTFLGLFQGLGSLPGYPNDTYATLKTDGEYIGFSASGLWSTYMDNGGGWHPQSSRAVKENYQVLDLENVLSKIDQLPVMKWNYKFQDPSTKHIGPFAEDFHDLFGLSGADNKTINSTDLNGVTLAGVKALIEKNKELEKRVSILEEKINSL